VHSSIDGATLTLRGASHAIPFEERIALGTAPELLEVSAPGREGRRFWVELDRSVVLDVDLPRGRGTRDADERETRRAVEGAAGLAPPSQAPHIATSVEPPPSSAVPEAAPEPTHVPPPTPTAVYTGPSGDIPDSI
jgi:hypothetical protein